MASDVPTTGLQLSTCEFSRASSLAQGRGLTKREPKMTLVPAFFGAGRKNAVICAPRYSVLV